MPNINVPVVTGACNYLRPFSILSRAPRKNAFFRMFFRGTRERIVHSFAARVRGARERIANTEFEKLSLPARKTENRSVRPPFPDLPGSSPCVLTEFGISLSLSLLEVAESILSVRHPQPMPHFLF